MLHISSSYAKILRETNVQPREFPRSGSKAKDIKEERERDRKLVITMACYALQMPHRVAHASRQGQNRISNTPGLVKIKYLNLKKDTFSLIKI